MLVKKLNMTASFFAGAGSLLFGVAWIIGGLAMARSPLPNPMQKLIGYGMFFWGIAMLYFASDLMRALDCSHITLYSLRGCVFCDKARDALRSHNRQFDEVEYVREDLRAGTETRTMPDGRIPEMFPQIWVSGRNMGGASEIESWVHRC